MERDVPTLALWLVLATGLLLLGYPFRFQTDASLWQRVMDAGHLPLFAGFTVLLHRCGRRWHRRLSAPAWIAAFLASSLAVAVELLQPAIGRDASVIDLVNGLLGVGVAVASPAVHPVGRRRSLTAAWMVASALVIGYAAKPVWDEWQGIRQRDRMFPLLGDFESSQELRVWYPQGGTFARSTRIARSPEHASRGRCSLEVQLGSGLCPGVNFQAGHMDWSAYGRLGFDVFNPGRPFELLLRIDDDGDCFRAEARYVQGFSVSKGWNRLALRLAAVEAGPQSRELNLHAIRRLVFFAEEAAHPSGFFLDNVRLE